MLKDSIIVFTTDNGGPAGGYNRNVASNWPLRGVKDTLWEGGVRGAALVWSPRLRSRGRVSDQMMTIQDWLPTLYSAAGGRPHNLANMDGMNMWPALDRPTIHASPRSMLLHNIDGGDIGLRVGNYKLIRTARVNNNWYGPHGRDGDLPRYDVDKVLASPAGRAVASVVRMPSRLTILRLRRQADVKCPRSRRESRCNRGQVCVFNIKRDPCERNNLVVRYKRTTKVI